MGVYLTGLQRWLNGRVPCVCGDRWALGCIEYFNRKVGKMIFVSHWLNEADYVRFTIGTQGQCMVGKQGGAQNLNYSANDLYRIYHEMGHSLGLGHEFFHSNWPLKNAINARSKDDVHKIGYNRKSGLYTSYLNYDPNSIMCYSPTAFGFSADGYVQPQDLSAGDVALIRFLYPSAPDLYELPHREEFRAATNAGLLHARHHYLELMDKALDAQRKGTATYRYGEHEETGLQAFIRWGKAYDRESKDPKPIKDRVKDFVNKAMDLQVTA